MRDVQYAGAASGSDADGPAVKAGLERPLAALLRYRHEFAGQRVVLPVTGRNLDVETLARALRFVR